MMPHLSVGVRQIAARAAGHQDFHARPAVLFEQQRPPAALGRLRGGHQAGGTRADNDYVVRVQSSRSKVQSRDVSILTLNFKPWTLDLLHVHDTATARRRCRP